MSSVGSSCFWCRRGRNESHDGDEYEEDGAWHETRGGEILGSELEQTAGSESIFSDLDLNRFRKSENLLCFFLEEGKLQVALKMGPTCGVL